MKIRHAIWGKFKKLWIHYVFQSLLAALSLFIIVLVLGKDKIVLISSIGASSFIVFAMPKSIAAQTRHVIGGHLAALIIGTLFNFTSFPASVEYSLVVGFVIFFMVALDVEHPPAVGTALAVVINEVTLDVFITVMIAAIILTQCRHFLRHRLKDLI